MDMERLNVSSQSWEVAWKEKEKVLWQCVTGDQGWPSWGYHISVETCVWVEEETKVGEWASQEKDYLIECLRWEGACVLEKEKEGQDG